MKRFFLLATILLSVITVAGAQTARQKNLSLKKLMLFKVDGFRTTEDWSYEEITTLGITKKTEHFKYTVGNAQYSSSIDFWSWPGEKGSSFQLYNGAGIFYDTNNNLEIKWTFNPQWAEAEIQNKTSYFLLVDLSHIFFSFSGEVNQYVTPVGNNLRNIDYDEYDFAFIPPGEKGHAAFYSLSNDEIFPTSLPNGTTVQYSIHWIAFPYNPVDEVLNDVPVQEPHYYTQYKSSKRLIYENPLKIEGLVAYFTLPNNYCDNYNAWPKKVYKFETRYQCSLTIKSETGRVGKNDYGFNVFK